MGIKERAEEMVDRARTNWRDKSETRKIEQSRRAVISRKARDERNEDRYRKGEYSEDLYKKRQRESEERYHKERMTPEERATQVTERIVTGSAKAVAAFNQDLEYTATGRSRSGGKGSRGKKNRNARSSGSSGGGGGYGGVDFGQLGGFGGGGLDFGSLNGMFSGGQQRSSRKRR